VAQLIKPDGTVTHVAPNAAQFTLPELYFLIDATTIEIVTTKTNTGFLVIDENGKLLQRPYNRAASELYGREPEDVIVGPALLCERSEIS
jgi:Domain of unknown function (DUF3846)